MIKIRDMTKVYGAGQISVNALAGVNLEVPEGEIVAIMGPSGSGKSTLMNILGCLDRPTSGSYLLVGEEVGRKDDNELAEIRNRHIGFIFQSFNLLQKLTALENVELPLVYRGVKAKERRERAIWALEAVGLANRLHHKPNELSGGQMQRVAIARALAGDPAIILGDEPTGNLDSRSGSEVMAIFQRLHQQGSTIVLVTHDDHIARHCQRVVRLRDGNIISDERVPDPLDARAGLEGDPDSDPVPAPAPDLVPPSARVSVAEEAET